MNGCKLLEHLKPSGSKIERMVLYEGGKGGTEIYMQQKKKNPIYIGFNLSKKRTETRLYLFIHQT